MKITIETAPGDSAPVVSTPAPKPAAEPSEVFSAALMLVRLLGGVTQATAFLQQNGGALDVEANPSNTDVAERSSTLLSRSFSGLYFSGR